MSEHDSQPVISERKNGDRLIGIAGPLAQDLYDQGTPPVHGLASKPVPSPRVADVRIGDRLRVERVGDQWTVRDREGQLGILRWRRADDGRRHAVTGKVVRLPHAGTLHVQRLVIDPQGAVKDIGGYVEPEQTPGR
ncbi:hypothetical protein [Plantactinospora endophytica]|uniref:Uncharacterized protein n=1 Tax=Plantactinospora endophytica TaxID=673535 RepID=A0ABQ4ECC6_9ACTN|nr:hypothetical protein [Plantactinospora endophytica]GIG92382.1 hypothetical protein Pen02_73180 [Plantactinospora endophytica]